MQTPPSLPMKKPKTFMLLGVVLLILGIFYILGLLMNVVMAAVPAIREQNAALRLLDEDPSYVPVYYAGLALNTLLGLIAIAGGIGLIKSKNWGRLLGIAWAAGTILTTPFGMWVTHRYLQPVTMAEVQKQMSTSGASADIAAGVFKFTTVLTMVFLVFWVVLCIVMIIFLARPKMKAWCRLQETHGTTS